MGWITLDRKLFNHWLWEDKPFSRGQAWIDLIALANYDDSKTLYKGRLIHCKRGTVYRSISYLANRWGWSRKKTRDFLSVLEGDNIVSVNGTAQGTTITLIKYGFYQPGGPANCTAEEQQTAQQKNSGVSNEKRNINKLKEGKEYMAQPNPPTLEEVRDYCRSRGSVVNPEAFVAYYSARDWTLSRGQPMKDWKAQVRYWEQNERKGANNEPVNPRQGEHYEDVYNQIFGDDD